MLRQFDPAVPIERSIKELIEETLAAPPYKREVIDNFDRGYVAGYKEGLRRALGIVNGEIGVRLNPPDLAYGMERPKV